MTTKQTEEFYRWQIENNKIEYYGERTNHESIANLLGKGNNKGTILDLGCCTGTLAEALNGSNIKWKSYVGIDLLSLAVSIFNSRTLPNATANVGNATELETFPNNSFDTIIVAFLLQDIPREAGIALLNKIPRLLTAKGELLLALTMAPEISKELGAQYQPEALRLLGATGKYTYLWSIQDLELVMQVAGFTKCDAKESRTANGLTEQYSLWTYAPDHQIRTDAPSTETLTGMPLAPQPL